MTSNQAHEPALEGTAFAPHLLPVQQLEARAAKEREVPLALRAQHDGHGGITSQPRELAHAMADQGRPNAGAVMFRIDGDSVHMPVIAAAGDREVAAKVASATANRRTVIGPCWRSVGTTQWVSMQRTPC